MESTENSSQPGEGSTSNPEQGSSSHPEQSSSSMSHAVSTPAHLDPPCSRPTLDQPSCSSEYNLDSKKKVSFNQHLFTKLHFNCIPASCFFLHSLNITENNFWYEYTVRTRKF